MYDIQKKVPVAKIARPPSATRRKYPFDTMEIGDMFFVPGNIKNTLTTHVSAAGKKLGRKFTTRLCHMTKTKEGWAQPKPGAKSQIGVGVWRVE
jgi:hypothetical protein